MYLLYCVYCTVLLSMCHVLCCTQAVDFSDAAALTPQAMLHFRLFFEVLLTTFSKETVWGVFSRLATAKNLADLRNQITVFLARPMEAHAVALAKREGEKKGIELLKRCKLARKALLNIAGTELPSHLQ